MALIDKLTAIADAIRAKTGKAEEMTLDQMPSEIAGISGGGVPINNQDKTITENGTYTADEGYTGLGTVTVDVASNTLVELTTGDPSKNTPIANIQNLAIYCGNVVRIGEGAFQNAYSLKRAVFPNAEHIDSSAFNSCSSLEVVVAANASRVSDTAFNNCMNLKEFASDALKGVGAYAFYNCSSLEVIQLDDYDPRVSENAFGYCEALRYVKNIHAIYYVSDGVFQNCKELEIGTDAFVTCYIGENAFRGCSKLREIHVLGSNPLSIDGELTHQISIGNSAFRDCISLEKVVLGYEDCRNFGINIGAEAFSNCPEFKALVLNRDVVATVNLTSILGTKIATAEGMPTGEGFIYAPSALYEDYVANFTMQIVAGFGLDEATADYMSRAILRKNEDYPDICG